MCSSSVLLCSSLFNVFSIPFHAWCGVAVGPDPLFVLTPAPSACRQGSGSHKVLYVLVNSRTSSAYFSTTIGVTSKTYLDLDSDRGWRPKLKSEEFCEVTSLVVEII
jgi:hypothetical protein